MQMMLRVVHCCDVQDRISSLFLKILSLLLWLADMTKIQQNLHMIFDKNLT